MDFEQALIWFGCLIVAVILHEISHGIVALYFGDDTAKNAGRLTLNPVPHIDPLGSIILPAMGALTGIPVIAWAKPVPVDPSKLRDPRRDMLWVGLVGPFSNFVLAITAALFARALFPTDTFGLRDITDFSLAFQIAFSFALVNVFLGVFNLLPIPPLDGSSLLERVLPRDWLPIWNRMRPYGMLVLFALVFWTGVIDRLFEPVYRQLANFVSS